ncbi:MAG: ATP-binding protein [Pseudomonadota bacterium]
MLEERNVDIEKLQNEIKKLKKANSIINEENVKLEKINAALMYRMEEGSSIDGAYRAFEHSVKLSEKVNEQTEKLTIALQELEFKNVELAKAQETTRMIEQQLINAIESIHQPMALIDENNCVVFFNSKFATFWDTTKLTPRIGDDYDEIIRKAKYYGSIKRALPSFDEERQVYELADNKWYQLTEHRISGRSRVMLFNDVTEVRERESSKYERVIRQKNKNLQALIDNINVGILRVKENGEIEYWNNTMLNQLNVTHSQMSVYKKIETLSHAQQSKGIKFDTEADSIQKIHDDLILERCISTLGANSILYTFTDITSKYQYAKHLQENERWVRMITDNIPALIAYIGADNNFHYTNKAYKDWYGISENDNSNADFKNSQLSKVLPKVTKYIERVKRGEVVTFLSEEQDVNENKGVLQKVYLPHFDDHENIVGHFVLATDITEQVQSKKELVKAKQELESRVYERTSELNKTNEALQEAVENKSKFMAALSHDLLQPLSAAVLFNESLRVAKSDGTKELVEAMGNSLADLDSLIRTLIDISKLDAGLVQPSVEEVNLTPLLQQLASEFGQLSADYNVQFSARIRPLTGKTDPALLSRILRNLLSNAMKYGANGRVLLSARKRNNLLQIHILDQGPGISQDEQEIIFKEFKRLPNSINYSHSLGLGLSIVQKMTSLLGHQVTVNSKVGKGSCFTVSLPLAENKTPSIPLTTQENVQALIHTSLSDKSIWHIDNDVNVRLGFQALFEQWDVDLQTYNSFTQCLSVNDNDLSECDLLIVDYHLDDDQDGLSISKRVRELKPSQKVILCTANHSEDLAQKASELKIPIVYKPISPLKLRTQVTQLLTPAEGILI